MVPTLKNTDPICTPRKSDSPPQHKIWLNSNLVYDSLINRVALALKLWCACGVKSNRQCTLAAIPVLLITILCVSVEAMTEKLICDL